VCAAVISVNQGKNVSTRASLVRYLVVGEGGIASNNKDVLKHCGQRVDQLESGADLVPFTSVEAMKDFHANPGVYRVHRHSPTKM